MRDKCFLVIFLLIITGYFLSTFTSIVSTSFSNDYIGDIISLSKSLSNTLIILAFVAIFKEKGAGFSILFVLMLSIILGEANFFEDYVASFFNDYKIHIGNPQYPRLIFCLITAMVSFLSLIMRKFTYFRLFSFVGVLVVITTSLIFHFTIVTGALKEYEKINSQILNYTKEIKNHDELVNYCRVNKLICIKNTKHLNEDLLKEEKYFLEISDILSVKIISSRPSVGFIQFKDEYVNYQAARYRLDDSFLVIIDMLQYNTYKERHIMYFYFLSACAHFFWVLGVILLSALHEDNNMVKLFIIKLKKKRNIWEIFR